MLSLKQAHATLPSRCVTCCCACAANPANPLSFTCSCRAVPPSGLAPLSASLVALHTGACRAVHALLSCCGSVLCLAALEPLPGHGGRLNANAAAWLTETLLSLSMALLAAVLQSGPADGSRKAAAHWDRWGGLPGHTADCDNSSGTRHWEGAVLIVPACSITTLCSQLPWSFPLKCCSAYVRCLLELTAAVSALQPHTLGCKRRRRVKWLRPTAARQRALAALQQLTTPRFARQCGLGIAGGSTLNHSSLFSKQGVLAALAGRLSSPASRELLPPLLKRLLPPAEAAGQEAAYTPVPPAAAVLQAQALAQRPCAYLLCSSLADCSEGEPAPRGKRCSRCCMARYCSRACQVADWPAHRPACRGLAAAASVSCAGK